MIFALVFFVIGGGLALVAIAVVFKREDDPFDEYCKWQGKGIKEYDGKLRLPSKEVK